MECSPMECICKQLLKPAGFCWQHLNGRLVSACVNISIFFHCVLCWLVGVCLPVMECSEDVMESGDCWVGVCEH